MNYRKAAEAADYIKTIVPDISADTAILTGTGMVGIPDMMENKTRISYADIPYFPESTVKSHAGECIIGTIGGKQVILFSGRFHYYEGYKMEQIVFPVRVIKILGVTNLFMTNASGGLSEDYNEGDIVVVSDHINLLPRNPLRGKNDTRFGIRFPDMLDAYSKELRAKIKTKMGDAYKEGVYVVMPGPSLETPAEYNYAKMIGGDLIGMSTVPEVIAAVHCELKVAVFAIVTNICYPIEKLEKTTVEEVIAAVSGSAGKLNQILEEMCS